MDTNKKHTPGEGISRRSFLKASMLGVGLSAMPAIGLVLPAGAEENETPEQAAQRVTSELPIP